MIQAQRQSGMTLIEILITVLIMAIGLLGMSGLQSSSIKGGLDIAQRSQALWLANSLADRMRANPTAIKNYASVNTTNCGSMAPTNCSDHGANVNSSTCTAAETASFDMWEIACGQTPAAGTLTNSIDSLDVTAVNITCEDGTCDDNVEDIFHVDVVYTSKLVNSSKLMSSSNRTAQQSQTVSIRVVPTYDPATTP